jgi:hypothetical protein
MEIGGGGGGARMTLMYVEALRELKWVVCTCKYSLRRREITGGWGEVDIEVMLAWVKYRVRSPKFIWAPCAHLYSLAETPQQPPYPRIWAHIRGHYWLMVG